MARIVRREVRRRSGWGTLWRVLFFAWNIVLGLHTLLVVGRLSRVLEGLRGLEGVVWTNVGTLVLVRQLAMWAAGAVILGLLAYATRGQLYLVDATEAEVFDKPEPRKGFGLWWIPIVAGAVAVGFVGALVVFGIPRR